MTKKPKSKKREITKYTEELAIAFTGDLASMSLDDVCKKYNIHEATYYRWLHKHKKLCELSTEARSTKATYHFDQAAKVIEELSVKPNNEETRVDIARLRFDGHLRLAGKANQGLYGDKGSDITFNNNTQNNFFKEGGGQLDDRLQGIIDINKKEK